MLSAALNSSDPGSPSPLALRSDLTRATRGVISFLGPLLLAQILQAPPEFALAAIAAQNLAFFEVRGDYRLRFAVVGCALLVLTGAAALGAATSSPFALALASTAFVAAGMGVWRHLTPDYGPPLAISSMLVFLIAQESALDFSKSHFLHTVQWTLGGGLWGIVVQIVPWFFRPQQPLRSAVAEAWISAAEFFETVAAPSSDPAARHSLIVEKEAALRTALDKSYTTLASAHTRRSRDFVDRLERISHAAARLTMRVSAFQTALDTTPARETGVPLQSAFQPILVSLGNHARTIALALVSRQPAHLVLVDVRLRRLLNLLEAFESGLNKAHSSEAHLSSLCDLIREALRETETVLRATINRSEERAAFSLELTDTDTWSLRPLGAALNFSWRVDPVLLRFTIRLIFLTLIAAALAHALSLPHGYWLPFTLLVVLQPDYGSTRARAAQRVAGTLLGSFLALGLLWLALPSNVLFALMTVCLFAFGFFMKRNYSIGVLFVTIFVMLLTGLHQPVMPSFAWERIASNVLGGVLALAGAFVFWPVWERRRFPAILAASLRANLHYWEQINRHLQQGIAFDDDIIKAKQRVEGANAAVFASLQRLAADPKNRREGLDHIAALANGNLRLTRAFNVVALQTNAGAVFNPPAYKEFSAQLLRTLETIASTVEGATETPDALRARRHELGSPTSIAFTAPDTTPPVASASGRPVHHTLPHLRAALGTELAAMLLATESCQALGMFEDLDENDATSPAPAA
ncbi:MAG: FUSC family protein [Nibricoccus sp.]